VTAVYRQIEFPNWRRQELQCEQLVGTFPVCLPGYRGGSPTAVQA